VKEGEGGNEGRERGGKKEGYEKMELEVPQCNVNRYTF